LRTRKDTQAKDLSEKIA